MKILAIVPLLPLLAACSGGDSRDNAATVPGADASPANQGTADAGAQIDARPDAAPDSAGFADSSAMMDGSADGATVHDPAPFGQNPTDFTLTFDEEFDGTTLDTAKWIDHLWYLPPDPTPNYAVGNGSLKMWPVAGTSFTRDYRHITTDGLHEQTYGYFEIEAKLPYGKGPWPAFWLYNHDGTDRPEIDIMEAYPGGGPSSGWSTSSLRPTAYGATIWLGPPNAQGGYKMIQTPDLSAAFHKYAVKWEPNAQTFYFDGVAVYRAAVSMSSRMYILLSFQFGSASGAGDETTPTGTGNSYEINYVRAWKTR